MSYRLAHLAALLGCVLAQYLPAQVTVHPDPVGTWRGTSLCQVLPSPCHDENVVYRITRTNNRDSLAIDARKIVNAAEEQMGLIQCQINAATAQLTCTMPNGVWRFTIRGDSLVGDLRLPDGTKFRDVRTVRSRGHYSWNGPRSTRRTLLHGRSRRCHVHPARQLHRADKCRPGYPNEPVRLLGSRIRTSASRRFLCAG